MEKTLLDGVPPAVDEIFRQGMSRDPMERPASCGEFMEALRAVVGEAPGDAADPDHASVSADAADPPDPNDPPTADVAPDDGAPDAPVAPAPAATPKRTKRKRKRKKKKKRRPR